MNTLMKFLGLTPGSTSGPMSVATSAAMVPGGSVPLGEFQSYGSADIYMTAELSVYSPTNDGSQTLTNPVFTRWTSPEYFETSATNTSLFLSRIFFSRTAAGVTGPQFFVDAGNLVSGGGSSEAVEQNAFLAAFANGQTKLYIGLPNTEGNQVRVFNAVDGDDTDASAAFPANQYIGFVTSSALAVPNNGFTAGTPIRIEFYPAGGAGAGLTANDDYGLFGDAFDLNNDYGTFEAGDGTTDYGSF